MTTKHDGSGHLVEAFEAANVPGLGRDDKSIQKVDTVIGGSAVGFQQITDLSSAVGLTVPTGAIIGEVDIEAQAVRYRVDGTNPTGTVGMGPFDAGTRLIVRAADLTTIKFIQAAAGAKLNITYYGA